LQESIANPHLFYGIPDFDNTYKFNWVKIEYLDLWDLGNTDAGDIVLRDNTVVKTIYDPSPAGFKMPPGNAFTGFTKSGNNEFQETIPPTLYNVSGGWDSGWWVYPNRNGTGTPVLFSGSPKRSYPNGSLSGRIDNAGQLWTAGPATYYVYALTFSPTHIWPRRDNTSCRADACAVRPIK
jgi:hypothetical protein